MTFKKLTRAGHGLAIGALLGIALAMFASGHAFAETPAAAPPHTAAATFNKGDTAWMLTSTVLVLLDDHSGPRAVLRRPRALQEHALGADAGVLHGLHRLHHLGVLRLQPHLHRRLVVHRRLLKVFLRGVTTNSQAATFSNGVTIPELIYVCFQMTFAVITPALIVGAFAERMKFSALALFIRCG